MSGLEFGADGKTRVVAGGLRFPEGGAIDADGSVIVPEVEGGSLRRVTPHRGVVETVAEAGGGANGCAFGPDGAIYVSNNGGYLFSEQDGQRFPCGAVDGKVRGRIQRVDPGDGSVRTLFTESEGEELGGLNELVFDASGAAYVADTTAGRIHYMDPIAGVIRIAVDGMYGPNGVGLSPDGARLYVSETHSGRVRSYVVNGPGELTELPDLYRHPMEGYAWDGLAVDGEGHVCVADLLRSGVTVLSPAGEEIARFRTPEPDRSVTNLCFGTSSAYVSSAGRGLLYELPWPWRVLRLNFQP
ncbi:gluconolactonase [Prauserella sediminis]|uniref:Gluconolactonase n=1 Tax=Prauserella sediminis TaxID=577680 RepID=A0A839XQT0_9PSEU|nr:SMP-30/gluconolactonase/LRE family protein [Prauserella sediminis]MBB3665570.1 gluconolactonase [Prauserella sediminis]